MEGGGGRIEGKGPLQRELGMASSSNSLKLRGVVATPVPNVSRQGAVRRGSPRSQVSAYHGLKKE
jgi:hypothetical protein